MLFNKAIMGLKPNIISQKGVITDSLPNAMFKVMLDNGVEIITHLSGKMRINYIKLVTGDKVEVEMSVYDLTKGRVVRRLK